MIYREAVKKLKRLGCYELPRTSGGSHRKWFNPVTVCGTTIPDKGGNDLKQGTLRAAIKQLGIDWADFERA